MLTRPSLIDHPERRRGSQTAGRPFRERPTVGLERRLSDAHLALDKEAVLRVVEQELGSGRDPLELVDEAGEGMEGVGPKENRTEI